MNPYIIPPVLHFLEGRYGVRYRLSLLGLVATFSVGIFNPCQGAVIQLPPTELGSVSHGVTPLASGATSILDGLGRGAQTSTFAYSPGDSIVSTITFPAGEQLLVTPGPGNSDRPFNLYIDFQSNLPAGTYKNVYPTPNPILTFGGLTGQDPGTPFISFETFTAPPDPVSFHYFYDWMNLAAPFSFTSAQITLPIPDGASSPQNTFRYSVSITAQENFANPTDQSLLSVQPVPEPGTIAIAFLPLMRIRRQ